MLAKLITSVSWSFRRDENFCAVCTQFVLTRIMAKNYLWKNHVRIHLFMVCVVVCVISILSDYSCHNSHRPFSCSRFLIWTFKIIFFERFSICFHLRLHPQENDSVLDSLLRFDRSTTQTSISSLSLNATRVRPQKRTQHIPDLG